DDTIALNDRLVDTEPWAPAPGSSSENPDDADDSTVIRGSCVRCKHLFAIALPICRDTIVHTVQVGDDEPDAADDLDRSRDRCGVIVVARLIADQARAAGSRHARAPTAQHEIAADICDREA